MREMLSYFGYSSLSAHYDYHVCDTEEALVLAAILCIKSPSITWNIAGWTSCAGPWSRRSL